MKPECPHASQQRLSRRIGGASVDIVKCRLCNRESVDVAGAEWIEPDTPDLDRRLLELHRWRLEVKLKCECCGKLDPPDVLADDYPDRRRRVELRIDDQAHGPWKVCGTCVGALVERVNAWGRGQ